LVDTDVFIWYLRGNQKAYETLHAIGNFNISAVTYMELIQGMRDKNELRIFKKSIKVMQIKTIYIQEEISAKAIFYVEEFFLSHSMQMADALIGATASTYGLKLLTANDKHYKMLSDVEIEVFRK
jgi:predicted nucleic acid-binding protein